MALLLIKTGADLDKVDAEGDTPLLLAIRKGSLPMAKNFVSLGADPNAGGTPCMTPLDFAEKKTSSYSDIQRKAAEVAAMLRERGGRNALPAGSAKPLARCRIP